MLILKRAIGVALLTGALLAAPAGPARANDAADTDRRVRHYEAVERELRAADTTHLTPDQRRERERHGRRQLGRRIRDSVPEQG